MLCSLAWQKENYNEDSNASKLKEENLLKEILPQGKSLPPPIRKFTRKSKFKLSRWRELGVDTSGKVVTVEVIDFGMQLSTRKCKPRKYNEIVQQGNEELNNLNVDLTY